MSVLRRRKRVEGRCGEDILVVGEAGEWIGKLGGVRRRCAVVFNLEVERRRWTEALDVSRGDRPDRAVKRE